MKVKYTGPAKDYSGYGEAVRHDIGALIAARVDVTAQIPVYVPELSDYGKLGDLAVQNENIPLGYLIKIVHTTPNVYQQYIEPNKYMIGRAFWETDKVPLDFALNLERMHEIWTGSEFNKQAMRNAGVTKDIHIIPEAIDATIDPHSFIPYIVDEKENYKFYSIFEWTERKNPLALLEAYWREFENTEGVSLIIKTYQVSFTADKREAINQQIRKLRAKLNLKRFAPLYLYRQLMDKHQVYRFHATGDCFVSAHRGEGWGIPQMEALLMEKPIISTGLGGIHEYLENGEEAFLVGYKMEPVDNNGYNKQWYTPDQKWASVDIDDLRAAMRLVYNNQQAAKEVGLKGSKVVKRQFDLPVVGKLMRDRLQIITNNL